MNDYAYQIKGALENASGQVLGLRVMVCNVNYIDLVDVPIEVLGSEVAKYLEFRLRVTEVINIKNLPIKIQNQIRQPLGRWLDHWVLDNFYGDTSERKSTNP
jgi:hypothetical protein